MVFVHTFIDSTRIFLGHHPAGFSAGFSETRSRNTPKAAATGPVRQTAMGGESGSILQPQEGRSSSTMVMVTLLYGLSGNHGNSMVYGRYSMI